MADLIPILTPVVNIAASGAAQTLTFRGPAKTQYGITLTANCVFTIDTATLLTGTAVAPKPGMSLLLVIKGGFTYSFSNAQVAYGSDGPPIARNTATLSDTIEVTLLPTGDILVTPFQQAVVRGASAPGILKPLDSPWRGKSGVWFGTSIPAGGGAGGNYVAKVASILGMTITNESVGSSPARFGVTGRRVANTDPYGFGTLPWQNVFFSLGKTRAEADELITNYEGKYRALLTNNPPATLNVGDIANIRDTGHETKLARHLGSGRKDVYFFDHGHNDWSTNTSGNASGALTGGDGDMTYMPSDTRDRGTFLGVMNFLVDLILSDNPKARIVFIGHYEDARKPNVSAGQLALQKRWDFPLIPLWDRLGWSQETIKSGASAGKTMTQVWMPDDLHPHSDTSGSANDLIASVLAASIRDSR